MCFIPKFECCQKECALVAACCVLHNLAIDFKEPLNYNGEDDEEDDLAHIYNGVNRGEAVRNHIVDTYFT